MSKWMANVLSVVGVMALASSAAAVPLSPPATVYFPAGTSVVAPWGPLTYLASMTSPYATPPGPNSFSGTLTSIVYSESGGGLDFFYQVTATPGAHMVDRMSITGFAGVTTDVHWVLDSSLLPFPASLTPGTVAFDKFTRLDPDVVGANFMSGLSGGSANYWLVVRTNATAYGKTTAYIQDGGQATAAAFAPAPLPSSLVLFATGAVGLTGGLVRRFRRERA